MKDHLDRDFVGYGEDPPHARWPGGARIAINFNLNYEGGGEGSVADGDAASESSLTDNGFRAYPGQRSPLAESIFEYGSRVGVWRLLRLFARFDIKVSVLAVVRALERNPPLAARLVALGHEVVSHGWRWIDYHLVDEATERAHIAQAYDALARLVGANSTGTRPIGWMTGRPGPNTRRLVAEHGGFTYDRDSLSDELPYWVAVAGKPHLVIPYSYETNDNRFDQNHGFSTAEDFFTYMKDCFDVMYAEGGERPKLMSIGLHDRLIGRPGRIGGLVRFLEYARGFEKVWFCTGADVAAHWRATFPPR